jgi:hypothetical protein
MYPNTVFVDFEFSLRLDPAKAISFFGLTQSELEFNLVAKL